MRYMALNCLHCIGKAKEKESTTHIRLMSNVIHRTYSATTLWLFNIGKQIPAPHCIHLHHMLLFEIRFGHSVCLIHNQRSIPKSQHSQCCLLLKAVIGLKVPQTRRIPSFMAPLFGCAGDGGRETGGCHYVLSRRSSKYRWAEYMYAMCTSNWRTIEFRQLAAFRASNRKPNKKSNSISNKFNISGRWAILGFCVFLICNL